MRTLALLLLLGCTGADGDSAAPADTDVLDTDEEDTDTPVEKLDTGFALVYVEGSAAFSDEAWTGEEHYVATSTDGAVEHCRVTNATEGVPSTETCPGCTFAFEIVLGTGSVAGEACANMRLAADVFDGAGWIYAFAPTYAYGPSGYTYDDVLLFGARVDGVVEWTPWAFAEVHGSDVDYESIFAYTAYYYHL